MKTIENIKLLTIPETAEILGVCDMTVRRQIKAGKIPSISLGKTYIKVSDLCDILRVDSIDLSRFEGNEKG